MICVLFQYYYSIKDISIGGRCVCNGHADVCDKTDRDNIHKILCQCRHNTCGAQCDSCCPGFIQKPWKPATLQSNNECERTYCLYINNSQIYHILHYTSPSSFFKYYCRPKSFDFYQICFGKITTNLQSTTTLLFIEHVDIF